MCYDDFFWDANKEILKLICNTTRSRDLTEVVSLSCNRSLSVKRNNLYTADELQRKLTNFFELYRK